MVWTIAQKSDLTIKPLIDEIIASGKMSRQQHLQLASAVLSDHHITEEERRHINRVFDYVQTGRLKLVD
ncbi:MAG TPA: hypothetical protein V6C78_13935 [Crinalium sp.]